MSDGRDERASGERGPDGGEQASEEDGRDERVDIERGSSERERVVETADSSVSQESTSHSDTGQSHSVDAHPQPTESDRQPPDAGRQVSSERREFDQRIDAATRAIRQGRPTLDPELLLEYTTDRRDLESLVQVQWGLWTAVGVAILTAVLVSLIGALSLPVESGILVFLLLFALGMVWVVFRYRMWVYQIQADSLYLERGVVTHRRTHVPYVRIQHVDTSRGPLERWLGLSTLVVYTAGSRGADVSIPGLLPEDARDLQQRVKQLAIEADGGDAL